MFFSSFSCAQISQVQAKLRRGYLHLKAKSEWKKGILQVRLLFDETEIPGTRNLVQIKKGIFMHRFGPIRGKILRGLYRLEIFFKGKKYEQNIYFHATRFDTISNPQEIRGAKWVYSQFFYEMVKKLKEFTKNLEQKSSKLLKQEDSSKEAIQWCQEQYRNFKKIRVDISKKDRPNIFMPYSLGSFQKLRFVLERIQWLLNVRRAQIYNHFKVRISKENLAILPKELLIEIRIRKGLPKELKDMLAEDWQSAKNSPEFKKFLKNQRVFEKILRQKSIFREKVLQCKRQIISNLQEISQRELSPESLSGKDVLLDLKWFDSMFVRLRKLYQKPNFQKEIWEKQTAALREELKIFQEKSSFYEQSQLAQKYPKLMFRKNKQKEETLRFELLAKYLNMLIWSYTQELYKNSGYSIPTQAMEVEKTPKELIKTIVKESRQLWKIVKKSMKKSTQKKLLAREKIQKKIAFLKKWHQKLNSYQKQILEDAFVDVLEQWYDQLGKKPKISRKDLPSLLRIWRKSCEEKVRLFQKEIKKSNIKRNFPRIYRRLRKSCRHLEIMYRICYCMAQGDKSLSRKTAFKRRSYLFKREMRSIENSLKK